MIFHHEAQYRTPALLRKMNGFRATICGAGALGANLTECLARSGFQHLTVIDRDRIEARNLSTQPYLRADIGAAKAKMLAHLLYRAVGAHVTAHTVTLEAKNIHTLLADSPLVIDTFDNSASRQLVTDWCMQQHVPCLHVGLAADYAEVIWNDRYRVPSSANDDICDYPLARTLVTLAVGVAAEVIIQYVATGECASYTITLNDFAVRPLV